MDIHNYISARIFEPVSISVYPTIIRVYWLSGHKTRHLSRAYTADKLEQICDTLADDVNRAMGY